jgi:hypothetical protein
MSNGPDTRLFSAIAHPQKRAFLLAYAECLNSGQASKHAGCHPRVNYYWRKTDPAFAEAFEEARQMGIVALEEEAVRRAQLGVQRGIYYKDEQIAEETIYSDTLLIFLLKGNMPERYKERFEHTHKGSIELLKKLETLHTLDEHALLDLIAEAEAHANSQDA